MKPEKKRLQPILIVFTILHEHGRRKVKSKSIKNTQRLQKYFGYKLARNIAEYADAYSNLKLKGIIQLTNKKIERRKK